MHKQNQIAATLTSAGGTTRLKELLAQVGSASRTEFGRRVCQLFGFHDGRGHPQLAGCMKALALAARDTFIGWDADLRSRQLHRVVALSRFLIRPGVRCQNLASKALGLCLRRLPADFERRYGYRPALVETFVEKDRHAGTSLAAANWVLAGETAGRGRGPRAGRVGATRVRRRTAG